MGPAALERMMCIYSAVRLVVLCRDGSRAGVPRRKDATTNILGHFEELERSQGSWQPCPRYAPSDRPNSLQGNAFFRTHAYTRNQHE